MSDLLSTLIFIAYVAITGYYFLKGQLLYKNGDKAAAKKMVRKSFVIFILGALIGAFVMFIYYLNKYG